MSTTLLNTLAGARLLEPIDCHQHIQFIARRIAGKRLVDVPERPRHIVGHAACREFGQAFPCPQPSYPAKEQGWVDSSLRNWAESTETHSTDQNLLCEFRYNRHAFGSGKILPASQTSALWGLRVPPPVPEKLPPSEPRLLTRIQTAKAAIRVGRLRNFVGSDEEQTPELVKEWNARLARALKEDDLGACTRPEIVRVNVDRTKIAASKLARLERQATRRGHKREIQDAVFGVERISGSEFDGINYNGVRKTTRAVPNDVNRRSEYQKKYRHVIPYNPLGRGRTEEAEQALRNHADFLVDAARNEIQMTNAPIVEVAERMGIDYDWLRKQLSRGNQTLDLCKTNPNAAVAQEILGSRKDPIPAGFNIGVRLNNRVEIKYLGALTDSPQQHLKALLRLKKASVKDALKYERKQARKNGWNSEQSAAAEQAARARVEEAYRLPFEMFQSEIEGGGGNAVTVSP